jgi:quercetin dioxygenase-like cupin family protein
MLTVNVHTLPLQDQWGESNPNVRHVAVTFPFFGGNGTKSSAVVYFELKAGCVLGTHTDSAEEILLVLEGTIEATLGDERGQVFSGGMLLVPEMVPHNVRNVGPITAKLVGFFANANVVSTFEEAFQPSGMHVFDMAQIPIA